MNFTASSISTGMQCPKLYKYKYVEGYRGKATGPMKIGTLTHKGLEEYWLAKSLDEALEAMRIMSEGSEWDGQEDDWWKSDDGQIAYARCCAYVRGYYAKYKDRDLLEDLLWDFDELPVTIFVEKEFQFKLNGVNYRGKMDVLIIDHERNEATVIEHKTTSSAVDIGGNYFRRLPLDIQLTIYRQAALQHLKERAGAEWDPPLPRVIYDVIQTSKSAPRQKTKEEGGHPVRKRKEETLEEVDARKQANLETLEEFSERMAKEYGDDEGRSSKYVRHETMCTNSQHIQRLIELEEYVSLLENKGFLEIRNSTSCGNYGGCAFLDVCLGVTTLNGALHLEKREVLHPELEGKKPKQVSYNCQKEISNVIRI